MIRKGNSSVRSGWSSMIDVFPLTYKLVRFNDINPIVSARVETVVLMSKVNPNK